MSYKYFGEFLVHKKVIPPEALVGALIDQIKEQPPLCQLVFNTRLLGPQQMIDIFRYQQDNKSDFLMAARQLGYWNDQLEQSVSEEVARSRKPLGEILINRGVMDLSTLTRMLDEYLSQAKPDVQEVKEAKDVPKAEFEIDESLINQELLRELEQGTSAPAPAPAAEAAPSPAPASAPEEEFLELQPGLTAELDEVFDERKRKVIKVAMTFIKDKSAGDVQGITKLFQDAMRILHTINGLLLLLGVFKLEALISASEQILQNHLRKENSPVPHEDVADLLYRAFEEAWKLRMSIVEKCTEAHYFQDHANRKKYESLMDELKLMTGRLS